MKRALTYISFVDILFLLLLALSGYITGALGELSYFLSFLIPIGAYCIYLKLGNTETSPLRLVLSGKDTAEISVFLFPTLAVIFFISWITSLILSLIALPPATDVSGNIFKAVFLHAVLPAILEEFLFRYFPLRLLSPYGKRNAVMISALIFGLIHGNAFQIPYAVAAGVLFALFDCAYESLLPSLALHFLNNLISIVWMRNSSGTVFVAVFVIILATGAVISLIYLFLFRNRLLKKAVSPLKDKCKVEFAYLFFILMAMLVCATVFNTVMLF